MRAARLAGLVARQRPKALRRSLLVAEFARQATRLLSLGRNIRPVTRNKVVGSLGPDGRLKFLSALLSTGKPLAALPASVKPIWIPTPDSIGNAPAIWGDLIAEQVTRERQNKPSKRKSTSKR
jgi:hypothetical protein